ncbi:MerR family transcriptional regulator [Planococcus salinus]|uniref:MerR family transcriptional regulator n=1 Tax=Planococcus salinus TaxID=1848460 RepID=A0A3M8P8U6_9BACL|nr:MerR family transcriptional regulator [Planococcus salinus]
MYKVQEVAKIAGVSVRTLHHYDSIGLMKPSNIGTNRYRYYNDEDLKLLQHILFFKEIGFSLKKIQEIVAGGFDPDFALTQHIDLLNQKKERLEKLVENAELTRHEVQGTRTLTNEERFAAFSIKKVDDNIKKYTEPEPVEETIQVDEATAAAAESASATMEPAAEPAVDVKTVEAVAGSTAEQQEEAEASTPVATIPAEEPKPEKEEEDLEEINREGNRIYSTVSGLMHLPPDSSEVQTEMQAYYRLLDRFYECTPQMFRGLGELYASDSRFASNIDQHGEGLSKYLKEAMYIFAEELQHA